MANIPIYNDGRMPGVREAVPISKVPVASYQADYAGLARVAAEAYEQPLMPKDMYAGDSIAAEAWGKASRDLSEGMMDLGQAMVKVDAAAAKSKDYADLQEGRAKIQEESEAHDQFRQENLNPVEWVRNLDKHVGNAVKWLAGAERSPRVQAQLQADVQKMKDHGELQHAFDASALQMRRASEAHARKVEEAVKSGSVSMLDEAIEEGLDLKILSPPMAKALRESRVQQIYAGNRSKLVEEAPDVVLKYATNPEAKDLPAEFAGLGKATWGELRLKARESTYRHQRGLMEDFREAVRSSTVRDDADAEVWAEMHVPEGMRDATLRPLMQRVLHGEGVDMAEVNRIWAGIGAHDPKVPDAKAQQERLRLLHMQFPPEIQEELDGMLEARVKRGRPESTVMQTGRRYLRRLHEEQMYFDDDGKRLSYRKAESGGDGVEFDLEVSNRSALRMMGLEHEMEGYLEKRPETTPVELKRWLWKMTEREVFLHAAETSLPDE